MLPRSDDIETLHARAKRLSGELRKLGNSQDIKTELKSDAAALARDWLKISPTLRESGVVRADRMDVHDSQMKELLSSTTGRARASSLNNRLTEFLEDAFEDVVVPLIKYEGSPRQIAARQVQASLPNTLTPDETVYIEEAARCVTVQCYRAAIIMLWAAGIARVHAAITKRGFDTYNKAVDATAGKKGAPFNRVKESSKISSVPELQRSRDADLLVVGMELFGFDLQVFQELDRLLGTRNDAAHPGMSQPSPLDVQQFASKLGSLIFEKISL